MIDIIKWLIFNWSYNTRVLPALVMVALAAWRLSYMLVNEDGPLGMFVGLRRLRGITTMEGLHGSTMKVFPEGWPGKYTAFTCVYCMSVWCVFWLLILPWQVSALLAASSVAIWWHSRMAG